MLEPTTENLLRNDQRIDSLEELIKNFKNIVKTTHLQQRRFLIFNGKLKTEDHHAKSIEIKISYLHQYEREFIILIIRDTTQRDLLVTLEDNNKYKDQLLASVSHELRAPLNGTINLVESAVNDKNMPDLVRETLLTPALRSSKFLLHIINDILDMSQIKVQKLRLIFRSAKLEETLKEALQLVEVQAKKKGVELSLVMHPDIQGILFSTDHLRLSQIVLNLLNNAIKFTQKGSIVLLAEPTVNDPNLIKISVQDSGMGMTQENIKKLFSDYTHIEFAERKEVNPTGVGLGLSIAYSLAKLLGPKGQSGITVESAIDKGSTFSFIIENKEEQIDPQDILLKKPLSDKSQGAGVPDEFGASEPKVPHQCFVVNPLFKPNKRNIPLSSSKTSKCTCPKILVVDDNPFNTMAFEAVLGSLSFKCESVFDGHAAIEAILKRQQSFCGGNCKPYQVVFMDQEMPGLTGSETVQEIKRLQAQGMVPPMSIIGCTAHGSAEKVERFMKSGIDSCIHKPITANELKSILRNQDQDL